MNDVEIVVKSQDRTDFNAIGNRLRTNMAASARDAVKDVDRETTRGFKTAGEHSGAEFSDALDEHLRRWSGNLGGEIAQPLAGSFDEATRGIEAKVSTRFQEIGRRSGDQVRTSIGRAFDSVADDVEHDFSRMSGGAGKFGSSLDGLAGSFRELGAQGKLVAIVNALALLPQIASVAAGGITLALGGALVGLAVLAQSKNADVRAAFTKTKDHVVSEFTKISAPFHDTLLHVAADASRAFDSIAPSLGKAFQTMAPAVTRFSSQFASSLSALNPVIVSIGNGFSKVLGSIGNKLPEIMGNVAAGLKAVTDAAAANPGAITGFIVGVSQAFKLLGQGIGILTRFKSQFSLAFTMFAGPGPLGFLKVIEGVVSGVGKLKNAIGGSLFGNFTSQFTDLTGSTSNASSKIVDFAGSTAKLITEASAAAMSTDKLKASLDKLTGANQTAFDAQTNYVTALKAAEKQAKASNAGIDGTSNAAISNRRALSDLASTMKDTFSGKTPAQIDAMRDKFVTLAEGMGTPKKEAEDLADKLLGVKNNTDKIPNKKTVTLGAKDDTGAGTNSAKKNLSFMDHVKSINLRALDFVSGVAGKVRKAISGLAGKTVHIGQSGASSVVSAVSSAIKTINRFVGKVVHIGVSGVSGAVSAVNGLINTIRRLAGKVVHVGANVTGLGAVRGLIGAIAGVASKTVNIIAHRIGFAHGGVVGHAAEGGPRSNTVMVGEHGPELVDLPAGSRVRSNPDTRAALAGGAGAVTVQLEWVGGNAGDEFMTWLRKNIRVKAGSGPGSVQRALGGA